MLTLIHSRGLTFIEGRLYSTCLQIEKISKVGFNTLFLVVPFQGLAPIDLLRIQLSVTSNLGGNYVLPEEWVTVSSKQQTRCIRRICTTEEKKFTLWGKVSGQRINFNVRLEVFHKKQYISLVITFHEGETGECFNMCILYTVTWR